MFLDVFFYCKYNQFFVCSLSPAAHSALVVVLRSSTTTIAPPQYQLVLVYDIPATTTTTTTTITTATANNMMLKKATTTHHYSYQYQYYFAGRTNFGRRSTGAASALPTSTSITQECRVVVRGSTAATTHVAVRSQYSGGVRRAVAAYFLVLPAVRRRRPTNACDRPCSFYIGRRSRQLRLRPALPLPGVGALGKHFFSAFFFPILNYYYGPCSYHALQKFGNNPSNKRLLQFFVSAGCSSITYHSITVSQYHSITVSPWHHCVVYYYHNVEQIVSARLSIFLVLSSGGILVVSTGITSWYHTTIYHSVLSCWAGV